ncbi:hypothetical protein COOONC_22466 [Cooperia oncophora]
MCPVLYILVTTHSPLIIVIRVSFRQNRHSRQRRLHLADPSYRFRMLLLLAALVPLALGQSPLTKAWNEALPGVQPFWEKYQTGPHGVVIRGWQFSRCASEQWTNYVVNVSNIVIWPDYPRFPGPIFFNVTMDVSEDLPVDKIEMDLEVRHAVTNKQGSKGWQVIPCQGWNIIDGCDGVGSW